ncbi:MAG: universal stress protein [Pseudorhodobacter sp.]
MYSRILLSVDLTDEASWQHALPHALNLAQNSQAELHLVTVVPDTGADMVGHMFPPDFHEQAMEQAGAEFKALIAREIPAGIQITPHLEYGRVHDEILRVIEETGADLMVMGSHAPDRIREFLVGSHADRVVRRSPVSVLVVRG